LVSAGFLVRSLVVINNLTRSTMRRSPIFAVTRTLAFRCHHGRLPDLRNGSTPEGARHALRHQHGRAGRACNAQASTAGDPRIQWPWRGGPTM